MFLSSIIAVFIFFFLPIASHSCPLSFDNSDNCLTIVKYFHPVFIDALKLTLSTLHSSTVESSQIIVKLTTQKLVHAGGQSWPFWFSTAAGILTAPVKGVHYFRFTAFNNKSGEWNGRILLFHLFSTEISDIKAVWKQTAVKLNNEHYDEQCAKIMTLINKFICSATSEYF